ncbi:MAG: pyruvate formate lyase family protein [Eubacteriales bacterium]|nr:pyruvate formate lyase family protein [Eubacteriales bacterium]
MMTQRIARLKEIIIGKEHHSLRAQSTCEIAPYRDPSLPDHRRAAVRTVMQLSLETPALLEGERIALLRTAKALPFLYSEEEWQDISRAHYIHESGNLSNISADWGAVIASGLLAVREQLADRGDENDPWRESARMSIDAVLDLAARYAAYAREQGEEEIAQRLERVPAYGARSFPEALQSLRVLHYAAWCEGVYHVTLGRFDQYMKPYFEADLARGMTQEEALEWIEEFFLACNRDSDLYPGMQQGDNGQSLVLGGLTPEGEEGYGPLSALCLRASADLRVIDPKINLRVHEKTPLETYLLGTELTKLGLGFPQYENDDVVIPGLEALGYSKQDARDYVVAACWEFIIPGKGMEIPNIAAMPLAEVVKRAVERALPGAGSMEEILEAVREELKARAERFPEEHRQLYIVPAPYFSSFFAGCAQQGRDITLGCVYNNFGVHGTGLATAADSLAAVEEMVFVRGTDKAAFLSAMEQDFATDAQLRHALRETCPKMGNDDDRADRYARFLLEAFAGSLHGLKNERGGLYRAGTGSAMYYVTHAAALGATPDGRLSEEPLPANYAPSLCAKVKGPASVLRSFAKPDLTKTINGGPLTIEFHDSVFRSAEAMQKAAQLVRFYMQQGGHQLQLNTVNKETLLKAQAHPEQYKNLIVRVWGWSGYFVELDKCYQDHIIRRVEMTL